MQLEKLLEQPSCKPFQEEVVVASVEEAEVVEEEEEEVSEGVPEGAPEVVVEDLEVVEDDCKQRILARFVLRLFNLSSVQHPERPFLECLVQQHNF